MLHYRCCVSNQEPICQVVQSEDTPNQPRQSFLHQHSTPLLDKQVHDCRFHTQQQSNLHRDRVLPSLQQPTLHQCSAENILVSVATDSHNGDKIQLYEFHP